MVLFAMFPSIHGKVKNVGPEQQQLHSMIGGFVVESKLLALVVRVNFNYLSSWGLFCLG